MKSYIDSITALSNNPDLRYEGWVEAGRIMDESTGKEIILKRETANVILRLEAESFTFETDALIDYLKTFLKPKLKL